jgi:hypothetical protein
MSSVAGLKSSVAELSICSVAELSICSVAELSICSVAELSICSVAELSNICSVAELSIAIAIGSVTTKKMTCDNNLQANLQSQPSVIACYSTIHHILALVVVVVGHFVN